MTLSEFLNIGVILERVFEDCIVHPLQEHIYQLFVQAYTRLVGYKEHELTRWDEKTETAWTGEWE